MRFLKVDPTRCTGCRTCEHACSFAKEGVLNPDRSRIVVERLGPLHRRVLVCLQCSKPRCVQACPSGAIYQDGEAVHVDPTLCNRCGACVQACPRLFLPAEGAVLMCDQCGQCVQRCPESALRVTTREDMRKTNEKAEEARGQT